MPVPSLEIIFWKITIHKYVNVMYIYIYTYVEALFQNTIYDLGIGIARPFCCCWNGAYRVLEKSSSYINIYSKTSVNQ